MIVVWIVVSRVMSWKKKKHFSLIYIKMLRHLKRGVQMRCIIQSKCNVITLYKIQFWTMYCYNLFVSCTVIIIHIFGRFC